MAPSPISRAKALTIAPSICDLKYSTDSFSVHYVVNPPYKKVTVQTTSGVVDVDRIEIRWMESAGFSNLIFPPLHFPVKPLPKSYFMYLVVSIW